MRANKDTNESVRRRERHKSTTRNPHDALKLPVYRKEMSSMFMLTVTPKSPALSIMSPASSTVTAALGTHSSCHPPTSGGGWGGGNGPQTYLIVVAHVSIQLVHIMRTLQKSRTSKHQVCEVFLLRPDIRLLPDWSPRCRFLECRNRSQCLDTPRPSAHTVER